MSRNVEKDVSIVVSELRDFDKIFRDFIYKSVLIGYSSRPVTRKSMFQRLRFTNALKWVTLCIFYE